MAEHCAYCGDWLDDESNYVEIDSHDCDRLAKEASKEESNAIDS